MTCSSVTLLERCASFAEAITSRCGSYALPCPQWDVCAEISSSGTRAGPQASLLALLHALPAMGQHPAVLPFVLQALQRLTAPGT